MIRVLGFKMKAEQLRTFYQCMEGEIRWYDLIIKAPTPVNKSRSGILKCLDDDTDHFKQIIKKCQSNNSSVII